MELLFLFLRRPNEGPGSASAAPTIAPAVLLYVVQCSLLRFSWDISVRNSFCSTFGVRNVCFHPSVWHRCVPASSRPTCPLETGGQWVGLTGDSRFPVGITGKKITKK